MGHLQVQSGEEHPPTTQSMLIMIKAPKGINSKGLTVFWEEIKLWVVGKGVTPHLLPTQNEAKCVLVPAVNQSLAKKGFIVDCIMLNR